MFGPGFLPHLFIAAEFVNCIITHTQSTTHFIVWPVPPWPHGQNEKSIYTLHLSSSAEIDVIALLPIRVVKTLFVEGVRRVVSRAFGFDGY